jgi:hypothetical protein
LKVMRDGRPVTVEVTADGAGLVSHAGSALVAQVADQVGLTQALSLRLAGIKQRRRGHDPGRVIRDLAVMLVDGGECVSDLGGVREQDALFGAVASDSTAFRMVGRIAATPGLLEALRVAHARARARFWELDGAPARLTLDVDATLITAHSEKERAAGNYKGGYGFHPLQVYLDETREALGGLLRPGNAGSNTAEDHTMVIDRALAQIPAEYIESLEILVRADSAGEGNGTTKAELRVCARKGDVKVAPPVTLDGKSVPVTEAETQLLKIVLPEGNIFALPGGSQGLSVGHGWVALLHPLTPGTHTIVLPTITTTITVTRGH